jgi:hypothetical protein
MVRFGRLCPIMNVSGELRKAKQDAHMYKENAPRVEAG